MGFNSGFKGLMTFSNIICWWCYI